MMILDEKPDSFDTNGHFGALSKIHCGPLMSAKQTVKYHKFIIIIIGFNLVKFDLSLTHLKLHFDIVSPYKTGIVVPHQ